MRNQANKAFVTCGAVEASCHCIEPEGHDGPHVCECEGSWEWVDGEFIVHALPNPDLMDRLMETNR